MAGLCNYHTLTYNFVIAWTKFLMMLWILEITNEDIKGLSIGFVELCFPREVPSV